MITDIKREVVVCECESLDHIFAFRMFEEDNVPDELYLETHLAQYRSFWSRLWYGLKYAFGYKCRYGSSDSVLITKEAAKRMLNMLQTYVASEGHK